MTVTCYSGLTAFIASNIVTYLGNKDLFREMQSKAKGEYLEHEGEVPLDIRRKKTMKRIHEWERFEANCYMLKELEKEKGVKVTELGEFQNLQRRNSAGEELRRVRQVSVLRKAKSMGYHSHDQLSPQ